MCDSKKTKKVLIEELQTLRSRVTVLEQMDAKHKRTEEMLKESEARYKSLFEESAEGIVVADIETMQFEYVNPAICRMLGYSEEELKQMGVRDIHPAESLEYVISEFQAQARGDKTLAQDIPFLRKDGTIIYADVNTTKVLIDGREYNAGFFTDITEHKQTEEELVFKTTLLEAQSETSIDGILVVDSEGKSILFNKRFGRMWNIPPQILTTKDDERMLQYVLEQLKDPEQFIGKVKYLYSHKNEESRDEIQFKDGKVFDRYSSPLLASSGKYYGRIWYFRDITELKRTEQELQKARDELEIRVRQRTAELAKAVKELRNEISERKRAEEALAQERNLLRTLIDNLPDTIYVKDTKSRFVIGNIAVARLMGAKKPDELLEKTDFDFYPHELASKYYADEQEIIRSGQPLINREEPFEDQVTYKKGWVTTTKVPLRDSHGKVIGIVGLGRDITERKLAEEALAQERNLLRTLIDNLPDYIYVKDTKSRFVIGNIAVTHIMGAKTPDELIGKTDFDFYPKELASKYYADEQRVVRSGQPLINGQEPVTDQVTHKKGWVSTTKVPLRDSRGKVIGIVGLGRDITERKLAVEALREAEERFRTIFENTVIGLYRTTPDGRIIMANPALVKMLGYSSSEEVAERNLESNDFEPTYNRSVFKQRLAKTGKVIDLESAWMKRDGTKLFVRESAVAILDQQGNVLYYEGTVEDITERKRAEEKLLIYQAQLRSLASELSLAEERLRRRIATGVHDHIGQNLAIAKIRLESLAQLISSPQHATSLDEIRKLIAQTIDSTRSLTFELSPPVLYELGFEAAIEWLARQTKQQYGFSTEFKSDEHAKPLEDNVRVLLFQAVRELLVNVAKHAQAHNATVSSRRVDDQIQVSVEDDGVGFDTSQISSRDYKTGGFGLFSIRERLSHIGDHLNVVSKPGQGTRVTLVAPIDDGNESSKEKQK